MVSAVFAKLLQYGTWSGPSWTAGKSDLRYRELGVGRIFEPHELRAPGVDLYDNFVAKAHDINEVRAEQDLRSALTNFNIVSDKKDHLAIPGESVYEERLHYGSEVGRESRFVDFSAYDNEFFSVARAA